MTKNLYNYVDDTDMNSSCTHIEKFPGDIKILSLTSIYCNELAIRKSKICYMNDHDT